VRQKPPTAKGTGFSALEDEHGFLDLVIFKKVFEKYKEVYLHNCFLIFGGYIERDGQTVTMKVTEIHPIFKNEALMNFNVDPTQYFF
jgi:error-prone DNA polymerase